MPKDFVSESEVLRAFEGAPGDAASIPTANVIDIVLSNLIAARELLSDGRRWTQGDYCVGDAFCVLGALLLVRGFRPRPADPLTDCSFIEAEVTVLRGVLSPEWAGAVHNFNDSYVTTHADVLALFDRAIQARKGA